MTNTACFFICSALLVAFTGCFKEDDPVQPHPRGDALSDTIAMTPTYRRQVYVSLDSLDREKSNDRMATDLGFQCTAEGAHILLNTADFMKGASLGVVPFGVPQDTAGVTWWFDRSDGDPDSTVMGGWFTLTGMGDTVTNGEVFALDRGIDDLGNPLGYIQVIVDSLRAGTYYFRFAPLFGGAVMAASVKKDPAVNYRWFSFDHGGVTMDVEPPAAAWDLLFTQYTTLLFTDAGEPYPYLVTGVLINRTGVTVARDTLTPFQEITYDQSLEMSFSTHLDAIGYDWKSYNFETGSYTVDPFCTYIIRNHSGYVYKLRFTGFYNAVGQKGYPSFELQRM